MCGHDVRALDRRELLGLLGTGAVVAVAGCASDDDGGDNGAQTYGPNVEDHPGDEPIEFTDDQNCAVCAMTPSNYSQWYAQLAHENGEGAVFDTTGCLFAYLVANTADSDVAGAWAVDSGTGDLVDATDAHFVLITDSTTIDDPMTINPRTFADEDDALEFVEEWEPEELTEDDIIEFDEIDYEAASIYRENRI